MTMLPFSDALAQAYAHCESLTRQFDRDRWLAGLFAPANARPHYYALTAFSYDIGRLREVAREPSAGEIRLQWWREALDGTRRNEAQANPLALALIDTIDRFGLPLSAFDNMLAARVFDLYDDPMPDLAAFETYCRETCSALFRLTTLILPAGHDLGGGEAADPAGLAYATTGLLRNLPAATARGQIFLPADILASHGLSRADLLARRDGPALRAALGAMREIARDRLRRAQEAGWTPEIAAAFLPLALVPNYLNRMERASYRPFLTPVEAPQWLRQWTLWRAARRA